MKLCVTCKHFEPAKKKPGIFSIPSVEHSDWCKVHRDPVTGENVRSHPYGQRARNAEKWKCGRSGRLWELKD